MKMTFSNQKTEMVLDFLRNDTVASLSVTVVFKDAETTVTWKDEFRCRKLVNIVSDILYHTLVENCDVNEINHELASLVGIHFISIDSCSNFGVVTKDTDVTVQNVVSLSRYQQLSTKHQRLEGLDSVVKMLTELVKLTIHCGDQFRRDGMEPPYGILLQGPPGCGKTSIVKQVASEVGAFVLVVNGPELLGSRPGETIDNIKKIFNQAENYSSEGPCILFLDELDSMCGSSEKAEDARAVSHLCTLLDNNRSSVVIGATNRPNAIHKSLRRPGRMDREVFIGIPTVVEREEILRALTENLPLADDVRLDEIAESTKGYVGTDLAQLCRETAFCGMKTDEKLRISMEDFRRSLHSIRPSTARNSQAHVDLRPLQWSDIAGLDSVKAQVKQAVEWPVRHPEAFRRLGLRPPRGVLLYGPPGCAKTSLVRAAASASHASFLSVSGAQIYSPYVGEAERTIAQVFHEARVLSPSILFLDELDSIVGTRSGAGAGVQERVLSTLLNLIDGVGVKMDERTRTEKVGEGDASEGPDSLSDHDDDSSPAIGHVLVVGATNRPDLIDGALLRPGRMDRLVYVPAPDLQTRRDILSLLTSRMPLSRDVDLDSLAEMTENFTGADLENLCNEAGLLALTLDGLDCATVTGEHFSKVLEEMTPSLRPEQLEQYATCLSDR